MIAKQKCNKKRFSPANELQQSNEKSKRKTNENSLTCVEYNRPIDYVNTIDKTLWRTTFHKSVPKVLPMLENIGRLSIFNSKCCDK